MFWLGTWRLSLIKVKQYFIVYSLVRFGQPLQSSPSLRRVSISINDLQRRPKLLHISFGFAVAARWSRKSHTWRQCAAQPCKRLKRCPATQVCLAWKFLGCSESNCVSRLLFMTDRVHTRDDGAENAMLLGTPKMINLKSKRYVTSITWVDSIGSAERERNGCAVARVVMWAASMHLGYRPDARPYKHRCWHPGENSK